MKRVTPLYLSEDERTHAEVFVPRSKANARSLTRAHVLLKCYEGWSTGDIAEAFPVLDQAGGVEAVLIDKRQARSPGTQRCASG